MRVLGKIVVISCELRLLLETCRIERSHGEVLPTALSMNWNRRNRLRRGKDCRPFDASDNDNDGEQIDSPSTPTAHSETEYSVVSLSLQVERQRHSD